MAISKTNVIGLALVGRGGKIRSLAMSALCLVAPASRVSRLTKVCSLTGLRAGAKWTMAAWVISIGATLPKNRPAAKTNR